MEFYSNYCNDLKDSKGTRTFMERVTKLIEAMMSRSPQNTLKENSEQYTVSYSTNLLKDFTRWLNLLHSLNIPVHSKYSFSSSLIYS